MNINISIGNMIQQAAFLRLSTDDEKTTLKFHLELKTEGVLGRAFAKTEFFRNKVRDELEKVMGGSISDAVLEKRIFDFIFPEVTREYEVEVFFLNGKMKAIASELGDTEEHIIADGEGDFNNGVDSFFNFFAKEIAEVMSDDAEKRFGMEVNDIKSNLSIKNIAVSVRA